MIAFSNNIGSHHYHLLCSKLLSLYTTNIIIDDLLWIASNQIMISNTTDWLTVCDKWISHVYVWSCRSLLFARVRSLNLSGWVTFFESLFLDVGLHLADGILEVLLVPENFIDILLLVGSGNVHKSDILGKRTHAILEVNQVKN